MNSASRACNPDKVKIFGLDDVVLDFLVFGILGFLPHFFRAFRLVLVILTEENLRRFGQTLITGDFRMRIGDNLPERRQEIRVV